MAPNFIFEDVEFKHQQSEGGQPSEDATDDINEEIPNEVQEEQKQGNVLNDFVTKVPEADAVELDEDGNEQEVDLHRQHFEHTLSALHFIRNYLTVVPEEAIEDKLIYLPEPWN